MIPGPAPSGIPSLAPMDATALVPVTVATEPPAADLAEFSASEAYTWADGSLAPTLTGLSAEKDPSKYAGSRYDAGSTAGADRITSVVQLNGPVTIKLDGTVLTADSAVVWVTPVSGSVSDRQRVRIALMGNASLRTPDLKRSGSTLFVTAMVKGDIRLTSGKTLARDLSQLQTYTQALALAEAADGAGGGGATATTTGNTLVAEAASPPPARQVGSEDLRKSPISYSYGDAQTVQTADGKTAILLTGGVSIFQKLKAGDFLELRAAKVVLFTELRSLTSAASRPARGAGSLPGEDISAAYLEGDVRIAYTPSVTSPSTRLGEQRLEAERVYYDFVTGRAVLTDAVLHSIEPTRQLPMTIRAATIRQIAQGEYAAEKVELSTSSFAVPVYSLRAEKLYVRQIPAAYENDQARTVYDATNVTFRGMDIPFFYLPKAGGDVNNNPLRGIGFENSTRFGTGFRTEWGLYETLGEAHPKDLDVTFKADYLSDRGPATGLSANYRGGISDEQGRDPWTFAGSLDSYIIHDEGKDQFGGSRLEVEPSDQIRGKIRWEHQQFLPDDWQVQLRAGYLSDATFLEEYFKDEFEKSLPYETSAYFKRQRDTEALTLLGTTQLNDFPTTFENVQEQTAVQKYPEIGYRRIGDSLLDDRLTFFSANTASAMSFNNSGTSLEDQGYPSTLSPGLKSFGDTGTDGSTVYRGDFRQEVDYPMAAGQFKIVPYVVGRTTPYSDTPEKGSQTRLTAAAGARINTAFWKVDDTVESAFFDVHRMRHIVEPGVHLFTSAQTVDAYDTFHYDEQIDEATDLQAASFDLSQRWQTKRGGPGNWRTVDLVTFNVQATAYVNQPTDLQHPPEGFRGVFFDSLPENSIARNGINADASWRISDTTTFLADEQWNADKARLATISGGLAVQRGDRLTYFVGQRYVAELNSNITTLSMSYVLSAKYTLEAGQSYDLAQSNSVNTYGTIYRRFDRLTVGLTAYTDSIADQTGFRVSVVPDFVKHGGSSVLGGGGGNGGGVFK